MCKIMAILSIYFEQSVDEIAFGRLHAGRPTNSYYSHFVAERNNHWYWLVFLSFFFFTNALIKQKKFL